MSNYRYSASSLSKRLLCYRYIFFLFFLFLLPAHPLYNFSYADDISSGNYQLTYEKNLISISASKADLKSILTDIEEKTDISIRYPTSLDKKITIKINKSSLKKALQRLLKDFNYSIVYTGSKKQAVISDVYIIKKKISSPRTNSNEARITNRIRTYERRIETLKKSLSGVDEDSARGKRYSTQIKSYEKNIENLKRQLD